MIKEKVKTRTILQRIRRIMGKDHFTIIKTRREGCLGEYFILDLDKNEITHIIPHLEDWAREEKFLKPYEEVI